MIHAHIYITDIFKTRKPYTTDKLSVEHECIFWVNVKIYEVISTANLFPYTAKFAFNGVRDNKLYISRTFLKQENHIPRINYL